MHDVADGHNAQAAARVDDEVPGAVDVDAAGHLVVDTGRGMRVVAVGDVVHLR